MSQTVSTDVEMDHSPKSCYKGFKVVELHDKRLPRVDVEFSSQTDAKPFIQKASKKIVKEATPKKHDSCQVLSFEERLNILHLHE